MGVSTNAARQPVTALWGMRTAIAIILGAWLVMLGGHAGLSVAASAPVGPELASSEPGNLEELDAPPQEIVLTFTSAVAKATAQIVVGEQKFDLELTPDSERVSVAVPQGAPAGDYRVAYSVSAASGATTEGSLLFTVGNAGSAGEGDANEPEQPTDDASLELSEPAEEGDADRGGISSVVWVVAGLLVLGLALLVMLNTTSRKRAARSGQADSDRL